MSGPRHPVAAPAGDPVARAAFGELLAAADPASPRPLAGLVDRLRVGGLLVSGALDARVAKVSVRGVTHDSRAVQPGALFVAVPGARADGHDYLGTALSAGAAAALVERPVRGVDLPQVRVSSTRRALAVAAAWYWADPSSRLGIIGITGTDGKTTTAFLTTAALEAAGIPTGLVTTIAARVGGLGVAGSVHATTPEAPILQRTLAAMVAAGDRAAVVETTSHGLALGRVDGIRYDAAILTNITHEHLELHGTWEAYRDAKRLLFKRLAVSPDNPAKASPGWPRLAIVNADDPSAPLVGSDVREAGARLLTYGASRGADVRILGVEDEAGRLAVSLSAPGGQRTLALRLAGRFNAWNAAAVVALGEGLGLDAAAVRDGMESVAAVPGRMQRIEAGQPFTVVVDFAHSPASLRLVLDELAPAAEAAGGGLIAVFGSAGERDVEKRPLMGRIAGDRCRLVVLADEDPRGEDPMAILGAIALGAEAAGRVRGRDLLLVPDRAAAIRAAFGAARPGDVVLLAGKGHEPSIIEADGERPWDEALEARRALAELGHRG